MAIILPTVSSVRSHDTAKKEINDVLKSGYGQLKGYRIIGLGSPMFVQLTNVSSESITIQPEVIDNSLLTYDQVMQKLKRQVNVAMGLAFMSEGLLGGLLIHDARKMLKILPLSMTMGLMYGSYVLFSRLYKNSATTFKEKLLQEHTPITIEPGITVTKIFWWKESGKGYMKFTLVKC